MRIATVVMAMFLTAPVLAEDKAVVKEIPTKDLKIAFPDRGEPAKPTEIKSADELAKSAALKGAANEIKKHVNFEKEKLVFFAWSGSGQDRIAPDNKTAGTFNYTRGLTRDLRQHTKLFVVPKDAAVKVAESR